ncbi:hypothetical protein AB833_13775 [Chromatiales bacterium (ex Bugula neritina AB1)]|nr:hypothetical protein AB833_13775 [Chromatiales bacterium (ex Bugula neritina AB1)]
MELKDSAISATKSTTITEPAVNRDVIESIRAMLRDHPALLALENRKQALLERSQATLALPDPTVSLGINNISISSPSFDEFLPTNKLIGIRQEFPSRKGRSARADQALAQSEAIDLMVTAKRESLVAEVVEHLIEKRRINQQIDLARERLLKYDQLTEVVQSEIEAGNPSVFRLPEIDAERARVSGLINNLNAQTLEHDAKLIALTGDVPGLNVPAMSAIDWSGAYEQFHAVRIAQAELKSVSESLTIADALRFKRWGVQLAYQQRESGENFKGDDWVSGQVFFSAPLWYRQSQAPEQRAAEASVEAARQSLLLAQRDALANYTAFNARLQASVENINLLQQEVNAIQDKIETQMISYEAGIGYFAPIVDGDIALLKLRAELIAEHTTVDIYAARINSLLADPNGESHE